MEAGDFHPMNWLNLPVAIIHSPQYVGSDPVHRATWLNLSAYCASQENGGTIEDCRDWKCRRWQQTCGVTKAEVEDTCELWGFEGRSLVIWGYDSDKEIEVAAKRKGGKTGGLKRAENERSRQAELAASSSASSSASTEEKRREEKRIEEKKESSLRSLGACACDTPPIYADSMPTEAAADMLAMEGLIQSMRPGWKVALSDAEQQAMMSNARCISSIDSAGWNVMRDYLAARLPEGMPGYQPRSRLKFIEALPDVHNYAGEWRRKQGEARGRRTIAAVTAPRSIPRNELAEVFGSQNSRDHPPQVG